MCGSQVFKSYLLSARGHCETCKIASNVVPTSDITYASSKLTLWKSDEQ